MTYDPEQHHRHSIRLKDYDYSSAGAYFVTINTKNHALCFGNIINDKKDLSEIGKVINQFWVEIPNHFSNVHLDESIIMPNHLHGIIFITDQCRGVKFNAPTKDGNYYSRISPQIGTLSIIVRTYKAVVTRWCKQNNHEQFKWQRNYYEHIIRNEKELNIIREYILNNPLQWQFDRENPEHVEDKAYDNQWSYFEDVLYGKTKTLRKLKVYGNGF